MRNQLPSRVVQFQESKYESIWTEAIVMRNEIASEPEEQIADDFYESGSCRCYYWHYGRTSAPILPKFLHNV